MLWAVCGNELGSDHLEGDIADEESQSLGVVLTQTGKATWQSTQDQAKT